MGFRPDLAVKAIVCKDVGLFIQALVFRHRFAGIGVVGKERAVRSWYSDISG
ncbi:MAG: hypothetical protein WBK33_00200 [Limnochordia bacterium]